ncbi:MerR family transcriptional regulator [Treponema sp. OMZ 799]|uniref:MerR family transcriptional regulator n=1 Tax=Treponema sp. OMZ 799 TaxID=2563668 RepID=UPI0020A2727A|nr:MerR family transcriptional regulator [Treponema sp. OMZ 799]UTC76757.1 MerR family transcriptional regulator [Treponema sp. OMZ 799]
MTIKEFASKLGVSDSALRYYERIGVLKPIRRRKNGYREFTETDIAWMEFVFRLKATGMPIAQIAEFAELREKGESTAPERLKMLQEHEKRLLAELETKTHSLAKIREKIEYYKKLTLKR